MKKNKSILLITFLLIASLLASCGQVSQPKTNEKTTKVKIGLVGENNEPWEAVRNRLKKENIDLELVKFSDFNQPNDALADGSLDLNAFQHHIFLNTYNQAHKTELTPIGDTVIIPIGIYSDQYKELKKIKKGATVAIPNDVTNGGRALVLLQTVGLIKLDPQAKTTPTPKDITENKQKLVIKELDAAQIVPSLKDVDLAVVNTVFAIDAGLNPQKDAIYTEPVDDHSKPYINIIVANKKDKNNKIYQKIVKEYQSEDTKKVLKEVTKGSYVPAWDLEKQTVDK